MIIWLSICTIHPADYAKLNVIINDVRVTIVASPALFLKRILWFEFPHAVGPEQDP